ncbi:hypothetical protein CDB3_09485 [Bacillus sp. CDB3]|nr:hypothetical protein CDB3_09485 [Bacillus sp. CDB3]
MKKKNFISPSITASMISGANDNAVDETLLLTVLQARYILWGILTLFKSMVQNHHFHLNPVGNQPSLMTFPNPPQL